MLVTKRVLRDAPRRAAWSQNGLLHLERRGRVHRFVGPNVQVARTSEAAYPYVLKFPGQDEFYLYLTHAQAMTIVSRLAPELGLEVRSTRRERGAE
jgi:hypothetical protein